MRTSAAGNERRTGQASGFTLLELLVVLALIALASAGVGLSLRDSAESALQRDADRLVALLETGRTQARANGLPVVWRTQANGFVFEGLPDSGLPQHWLADTTRAAPTTLTLGPEPLIEPQSVALSSQPLPGQTLWVVTDGVRPFKVQSKAPGTP